MGYVFNYAALARIDAAKVAIVTATQPLFVTLYTVWLFGDWPTVQQATGGLLAILGVILVFRSRNRAASWVREE